MNVHIKIHFYSIEGIPFIIRFKTTALKVSDVQAEVNKY